MLPTDKQRWNKPGSKLCQLITEVELAGMNTVQLRTEVELAGIKTVPADNRGRLAGIKTVSAEKRKKINWDERGATDKHKVELARVSAVPADKQSG